jgi:hypothetical protein
VHVILNLIRKRQQTNTKTPRTFSVYSDSFLHNVFMHFHRNGNLSCQAAQAGKYKNKIKLNEFYMKQEI